MITVMKNGDKQKKLNVEYHVGFYDCETGQWYHCSLENDFWADYPSSWFIILYDEFSEFPESLTARIDNIACRLEDEGYSVEQIWAVPFTVSVTKKYFRKVNVLDVHWHLAEKVKLLKEE